MTCRFQLWNLNSEVEIRSCPDEHIIKMTTINKHIYLLSTENTLYHGTVQNETDNLYVELTKIDNLKLVDIDCCKNFLYIVDIDGHVFKCNENLEIINEIPLVEDSKNCVHGAKCRIKTEKLSVGEYGQLFVTNTGQLWASGYMPQIGINNESPRKVVFFDGRFIYGVNVGNDFAVALVSKQISRSNDSDSGSCNGDVFVTNCCSHCLSQSQLTSPVSLNSENCPLGVKLKGSYSYDIETTSTSSKNDSSSISLDVKNDDNSGELKINGGEKSEKNIIFRNTEAAKEFLSRQISWMSSAGEEYLVECTEKPTRIIRENVTNMASLVYEGVKTVGDKVVTLSRHVSGSSDCNSVLDTADDNVRVSRTASKEEFSLSLSRATSEGDLSVHNIQERANVILRNGSNLLNCEIWTWGNIFHGQLGIGDIIKRERPMIITKLSNIGVHKISVQSYHAAALTLDGRAYLWGRNDYHQVTVDNNIDQSSPRIFVTPPEERVMDITCGSFHTALLTNKWKLHYFGKSADKITDLERKDVADMDTKRNCCSDGKTEIQSVLFSSSHYTLLNLRCPGGTFLNDNLVEEQKTLEEMLMVQTNLIKITQKKNISPVIENLCQYYVDLTQFLAANVHSLLEFYNGLISEYDIVMLKFVDEHLFVLKNYLHTLYDVVSIDGFSHISKLFEMPQCLYKLRSHITRKDKDNEEKIVSSLLLQPLNHLTFYVKVVDNFINHSHKDNRLIELHHRWNSFKDDEEQRYKDAEMTKQFWLDSGKNFEHLKKPNRRLIRDSHKHPIQLLNAGRFSSHRFILFSDIFVHVNGSTQHVHDLTTVWIEPQQDELTLQYQLLLKMPEDNLILYTMEPEEKIEWFHVFQNSIKLALNKPDSHQPPALRSANYIFTKNALYKDAKYTGRWLNGKMHGSGRLEWNDGKVYIGQFSNSQICGFGRMEIPDTGTYEGQWKDNQQNGFGTFTYANNDIYKGHFKDGLPHGHGSLKKGSFNSSTASLYIGDWSYGSKNGYGIMDDIITGEKYLGHWSDNKKHGSGLIVTSDGIYYEGTFNQDVLTGFGLMILEDQTHYEGDFRGTGILNGKGTLTLPSGYTIEGNLTGSWNEGIKISSGTFSKFSNQPENTLPKSFETLCTPVNQKWKALFRYCYQILGVPENNLGKNVDTQKIWQNVAVFLSNSHQNTLKRNTKERNIDNSLNNLDIIPPFGREKLDHESFHELKQYLGKAFDSNFHPLGLLLNDLCVAYTATYGGLHSHPLLLSHAVSELHSITKRLYEIVRLLFPALPIYGQENLIDSNSDEIISCQSLLYPIILPRVYSSLFTLFTLKNKQQESQYWKRLASWNRHSDYTLMAFLSVNQKFLKNDVDQAFPQSPVKDQLFSDAVETLQQLKTTFSPTEKLLVLRETLEKMTPVAQEQLGRCYVWNMDDLLPIFLYVVVRARILQLGSELDFIEKFMEPSLESGELGLMFTTLKACYQQILIEKSSIN